MGKGNCVFARQRRGGGVESGVEWGAGSQIRAIYNKKKKFLFPLMVPVVFSDGVARGGVVPYSTPGW